MKTKLLTPIKDNPEEYERVEAAILKILEKELYGPLLRELGIKRLVLSNSIADLVSAIVSGRITFHRGYFRGQFNSTLSRELRKIGAEWDRKQGSFSIPQSKLPADIKNAIATADERFKQVLDKITGKLGSMLIDDMLENLNIEPILESTLLSTEKKIQASIRGITVAPTLTPEMRQRIAKEYSNNMKLYIKDFTEKEIKALRSKVKTKVLAGARSESMVKAIQDSYGVSASKAKFLARQETKLMTVKLQETRYQDAGVPSYKWACVKMPHQAKNAEYKRGEVRHDHGVLEGKIFRWDDPPIVNQETGERKNPGEDFNCRCFAIPIVRFA